MLDTIRTLTDLSALSGVHEVQADIAAARQRRALQQQAQRRARDCVEQAQAEAEAIRAQAFQEGYSKGMVQAGEALATGLLESQALGLQLRTDLKQAAGQLLQGLLTRTEWLDEMLERWLTDQATTKAPLQVLLPLHCRSHGQALRQRIQALWQGALVIDYGAENRYVFRLADQLFEFDAGASCQRLEPRLLARLENLPEAARRLDQDSMKLLEGLYRSLGGEPAVACEVPDEN
jgi:hypothetical protein